MQIRSLKYSFTLLLILAQLAATTGYTAMIHYCRMAVAAPDAAAAACCCVEETAPEVEPTEACGHAGTAAQVAIEANTADAGAAMHPAPEAEPAACCHSGTAAQVAIEANTADAGAARYTAVESEPAAAERPQPGLDRAPCCEFVSHFHHVDETAPLAPSMPTLVSAHFMILPLPDRHAPRVSVVAFASAPPDFQHTLPLLI